MNQKIHPDTSLKDLSYSSYEILHACIPAYFAQTCPLAAARFF